MTDSTFTLLRVNMNDATTEALRELAAASGHSYTEAVRHAISIAKYIQDARLDGQRVLIERDGDFWELT